MTTAGLSAFQRSFEISPIILTGGIAASMPNGEMAITALTEGGNAAFQDSSQYFAHFQVLPGSGLQSWGMAEYPFASVQMAVNATIQNQLSVSLLMRCPAQSEAGRSYSRKSSVMGSIKSQLDAHILSGGAFTVITPAYTYTNCLLKELRDVSPAGDKQVQSVYQWDFIQPLITQEGAQATYNNLMTKMTAGLPVGSPPTWSNTAIPALRTASPAQQLNGVIPFNQSPSEVLQFSPVLDGATYFARCEWNTYGQRYYISIKDNGGTLKISAPVTPSPNGYDISMTQGVFNSKIIYRNSSNCFEIK